MAEFQEVMRQLGRICANNFEECDICDLRLFCPSKTFLDKYCKSGRTERLEEMIMKWAVEHPEPVYPTWGDWLAEMGLICWEDNGNGVYSTMTPTFKMCTGIPADIAEKLGIEPKKR